MKITSTFRYHLTHSKLEEIFLEELRKQNWFTISISKILREELFLSMQ
jgi:hypothetical protein